MYATLGPDDFRKRYGLNKDYAVEGILAVGAWPFFAPLNLDHIKDILNELNIKYELSRFSHHDLYEVYEIKVEGRCYWYFAVMGTAVMHMYLHRGCVLGSKKNILVGSVGGLFMGAKPGDIVISTEVLGNDNARYYDRGNRDDRYYPNSNLAQALQRKLDGDVKTYLGKTVTCEMIMGETREDIDAWSKAGYLGVEMEAALVYSMSALYGVPAAAMLNIADNLIEDVSFFDKSYIKDDDIREASRRLTLTVALRELLNGA